MGYCTDFTITWDDPSLEEIVVYETTITCGETLYGVKWYDNTKDMRNISSLYPNVMFTVTGVGEEAPDFWKRSYLNGQMIQEKDGQVVLFSKHFSIYNFRERFKHIATSKPSLSAIEVLDIVINEFGMEEWE